MSSRIRCSRGQASVELVALLPVLVACAVGVWQLALAGHAVWASSAAARAAARASAVGGDARAAAIGILPAALRRDARVGAGHRGEVHVTVPIPRAIGRGAVTTFTSTARFEPQR
jgi:hypothetical protein